MISSAVNLVTFSLSAAAQPLGLSLEVEKWLTVLVKARACWWLTVFINPTFSSYAASIHPTGALYGTTGATFLLYIAIRITNLTYRVVVIVCQLLQGRDVLSRKEHYVRNSFVLMIIREILSIQIGRTAVVDKSPHIGILRCIHSESTIPHHNFTGTCVRIRHKGRESIPKRAVIVVIPNVK